MGLSAEKVLTGTVVTDDPLKLTLTGPWAVKPRVTINGGSWDSPLDADGSITVQLDTGTRTIVITPRGSG
jgi:hypothetical protein